MPKDSVVGSEVASRLVASISIVHRMVSVGGPLSRKISVLSGSSLTGCGFSVRVTCSGLYWNSITDGPRLAGLFSGERVLGTLGCGGVGGRGGRGGEGGRGLGGGGNPMFGSSDTIAPFITTGEMFGMKCSLSHCCLRAQSSHAVQCLAGRGSGSWFIWLWRRRGLARPNAGPLCTHLIDKNTPRISRLV